MFYFRTFLELKFLMCYILCIVSMVRLDEMRIQKKRIRNLVLNLPGVQYGTALVLIAPLHEVSHERLEEVGFSNTPQLGEKVLPSILGPVSRFNAEGSFIRHRDQPMETCYRQRKWTYKQWHGKERVEVTEFVNVPFKRYPRTPIPPPGKELSIVVLPDGRQAVATVGAITLDPESPKPLLHSINLMLELFSFCEVVDKELLPTGVVPVISLNWKVLPSGEMPWSVLKPCLKRVLDIQKEGTRPVVAHRLEEINSYKPKFVAVGHGGFTGYVVFGFPDLGIFVLECARYGNATYVFEEDWKALSKLSKAEILSQQRHKARIIHQSYWEGRIRALFREVKAA